MFKIKIRKEMACQKFVSFLFCSTFFFVCTRKSLVRKIMQSAFVRNEPSVKAFALLSVLRSYPLDVAWNVVRIATQQKCARCKARAAKVIACRQGESSRVCVEHCPECFCPSAVFTYKYVSAKVRGRRTCCFSSILLWSCM